MHYAYSVLDVTKSAEQTDTHVIVEGIASTPTTDRMGDIVEPLGAKFKTPMPLLWQHSAREPVGEMTFAKATKTGIPFKAALPIVKEAGRLKDRVDEAIQSLRYGLVRAVSIGFAPSWKDGDVERLDDGGYRFKVWEWLELSLVTIPANSEAVITAIKHFDRPHHRLPIGVRHPGASGLQQRTYYPSITLTPKG
jgi:HK97 family phage prohead protease